MSRSLLRYPENTRNWSKVSFLYVYVYRVVCECSEFELEGFSITLEKKELWCIPCIGSLSKSIFGLFFIPASRGNQLPALESYLDVDLVESLDMEETCTGRPPPHREKVSISRARNNNNN